MGYGVIPALIVCLGILVAWLAMRRVVSLKRKSFATWRKVVEGIVLSVVAIVAMVAAASSGVNAILVHHFYATGMRGQLFVVDGHKMRIDCMGNGAPTIVLDAGLGNDGLIWGGVQPVLAQTTRVCSFDRAGFGWSEAVEPPHDADHLAMELHGLLAAAKIDGPIVLMGHSIAGIYIRDYATRYPEQVAGLVFVDGSTPLQNKNPAFAAEEHKGPPQWLGILLTKGAFTLGMPRLFGQCRRTFKGFNAEASKLQAQDNCSMRVSAVAGEVGSFDRSGEETVHSGPYGALPILIFSQDTAKSRAQGEPAAMADAWNQMQENLKQLSTRSRRIIAKGSSHYIQIDRQELIEKEVPMFIEQVRGTAPQPTNYGTTVTE